MNRYFFYIAVHKLLRVMCVKNTKDRLLKAKILQFLVVKHCVIIIMNNIKM